MESYVRHSYWYSDARRTRIILYSYRHCVFSFTRVESCIYIYNSIPYICRHTPVIIIKSTWLNISRKWLLISFSMHANTTASYLIFSILCLQFEPLEFHELFNSYKNDIPRNQQFIKTILSRTLSFISEVLFSFILHSFWRNDLNIPNFS